jgi:hypothetical protein
MAASPPNRSATSITDALAAEIGAVRRHLGDNESGAGWIDL